MPVALYRDSNHPVPKIQEWIAIISVLGMLVGFVCSRAVMSISMVVLFLNIFWPKTIKHTFKSFLKHPFALFCVAYFLMVFIGGVWSENQDKWMDNVTLFLPMLTLPISLLTLPIYKDYYKKIFLSGLYAILLVVIGYSVSQFLQAPNVYIEGYAHSKQIPTIKYNDHIRFSLLLALSIIPGYAYVSSSLQSKKSWNALHYFIIASLLIIIAYLHLLAAKTGLVCLYLIITLLFIDFLNKKKVHKLIKICSPIVVIALIWIGYLTIPTFAMKIQYVLQEIKLIQSNTPLDYNYSSAGRIISYKIAIEEISLHPFFGVGTGDVMQHMRMGYQNFYPEIPAKNYLIPHSQYLYNLLAYGLVFFPILISMLIAPLYVNKMNCRPYLVITTIVLAFAMIFEAMLQVQLGLFVYLFFTSIWYRWDKGPDSVLA